MKKLCAILFLFIALVSARATDVSFDFKNSAGGSDYFRLSTSTNRLKVTPLDAPNINGPSIGGVDPLYYLPSTNGTGTMTNLWAGRYLGSIRIKEKETSFQFVVTNSATTIPLSSITSIPTNATPQTANAYTMATADGRFITIHGTATNGQALFYDAGTLGWWPSNVVATGAGSGDVTTAQLNSSSNVLWSFSATASNYLWLLSVGNGTNSTNYTDSKIATAGTQWTNYTTLQLNAVSNLLYQWAGTIGTNDTNRVLALGTALTNAVLAAGVNSTNFSLTLAQNGTNFTLAIAASLSNAFKIYNFSSQFGSQQTTNIFIASGAGFTNAAFYGVETFPAGQKFDSTTTSNLFVLTSGGTNAFNMTQDGVITAFYDPNILQTNATYNATTKTWTWFVTNVFQQQVIVSNLVRKGVQILPINANAQLVGVTNADSVDFFIRSGAIVTNLQAYTMFSILDKGTNGPEYTFSGSAWIESDHATVTQIRTYDPKTGILTLGPFIRFSTGFTNAGSSTTLGTDGATAMVASNSVTVTGSAGFMGNGYQITNFLSWASNSTMISTNVKVLRFWGVSFYTNANGTLDVVFSSGSGGGASGIQTNGGTGFNNIFTNATFVGPVTNSGSGVGKWLFYDNSGNTYVGIGAATTVFSNALFCLPTNGNGGFTRAMLLSESINSGTNQLVPYGFGTGFTVDTSARTVSATGSGGGSTGLRVTNVIASTTNFLLLDLAQYDVFKVAALTNISYMFTNQSSLTNGKAYVYFQMDTNGGRTLNSYGVYGGTIQTNANMQPTTNANALDVMEVLPGFFTSNLVAYWPQNFQPRIAFTNSLAGGGTTCQLLASQTTDNDFWSDTLFAQSFTNSGVKTICTFTAKLARSGAVNTTVVLGFWSNPDGTGTQYGSSINYSLASDGVTASWSVPNVSSPSGNFHAVLTSTNAFRWQANSGGGYANGILWVHGNPQAAYDGVFELDTQQ